MTFDGHLRSENLLVSKRYENQSCRHLNSKLHQIFFEIFNP